VPGRDAVILDAGYRDGETVRLYTPGGFKSGIERVGRIFSSPTSSQGRPDVTSNLPFDEWTSVCGSERITGALLDRLTHHVHILEMNGDSYRLNQSKRRSRRASSDTPAGHPTEA
jgi:hypothetical protein